MASITYPPLSSIGEVFPTGISSPFEPNSAYNCMYDARKMIHHLLGGTTAMREAGELYLPKQQKETKEDYGRRLSRSFLFAGFERTLFAACGKVMDKNLVIHKETINKDMAEWFNDIDLDHNDINAFSSGWFRDGVAYGVSYAMVDMPKSALPADQRTRATDVKEGIRPYLQHVPALRVIGWRHNMINGKNTLTQVRINEDTMVDDGFFGERFVQRIRVLEVGRYTVYERSYDSNDHDKKDPIDIVIDSGETGIDFIPFVAFYTNKTGPFQATSPLHNLAELNVEHWQSDSDQNNILAIARIPILHWAASESDDEGGDTFSVGGGAVFKTKIDDKLEYVEHTGAAIDAGDKQINNIEDRMSQVGFRVVARQTSGDVTATESSLSASESHAALGSFAKSFESSLEIITYYMAVMGHAVDALGKPLEPNIDVNRDFGDLSSITEFPLIIQMYQLGSISVETLINEAKRRNLLEDAVKAISDPKPISNASNTQISSNTNTILVSNTVQN